MKGEIDRAATAQRLEALRGLEAGHRNECWQLVQAVKVVPFRFAARIGKAAFYRIDHCTTFDRKHSAPGLVYRWYFFMINCRSMPTYRQWIMLQWSNIKVTANRTPNRPVRSRHAPQDSQQFRTHGVRGFGSSWKLRSCVRRTGLNRRSDQSADRPVGSLPRRHAVRADR